MRRRAVLPLVYDELRKLASRRLAHEKPGQTLQATAQQTIMVTDTLNGCLTASVLIDVR